MKQILTIIIFFYYSTCFSQNEISIPKNYTKVAETKGDLDKDGIDEIAVIFNTDKKIGNLGYEREINIYKILANKLIKWKTNRTILFKSNDGFYPEEQIDISADISNNTLILTQTRQTNSRHSQTFKNIFRYQNNDWFLIGSTSNWDDNCAFNFSCDINFSTGIIDISEEYHNCDDDEKVTETDYNKTFKYNFKEIPRMDGFTPGLKDIKMPKSDKSFNY